MKRKTRTSQPKRSKPRDARHPLAKAIENSSSFTAAAGDPIEPAEVDDDTPPGDFTMDEAMAYYRKLEQEENL